MRQILVKVKPNSKNNKVVHISGNVYHVEVTARPEKGKANDMVIKTLAKYFQTAPSLVEIKVGKTASTKLVIISG